MCKWYCDAERPGRGIERRARSRKGGAHWRAGQIGKGGADASARNFGESGAIECDPRLPLDAALRLE